MLTITIKANVPAAKLGLCGGGARMNITENIDCMKAMKKLPDKAFDLAVVDPPYFSGPERRGYYGCKVVSIVSDRGREEQMTMEGD